MGVTVEQNNKEGVDITVKQDGGVLKEIKVAGTGDNKPSTGDFVSVHYVGTLEDGTVFDSSRTRDELFQFNLGKNEVISAWDIGVASMKKGETCILTCKPEYAYGKQGSPPKIGPDATLTFEVELFFWEGEDISENKDKSVRKSIITSGIEFVSPILYSKVTIEYSEHVDQIKGDLKYLNYILGEGSEYDIPHGLEQAILKMVKGEVSFITINYPGIMQQLEYTIKLKCFDKVKDAFDMVLKEKVERGNTLKKRSNELFKKENYVLASRYYKHIVSLCEEGNAASEQSVADEILLAGIITSCRLNGAMCHLKLECFADCIECCDKVLEVDAVNVKALFRRGVALKSMSMFVKAIIDFRSCLGNDPTNAAAKNQLSSTLKLQHDQVQAEKSLYSNMFKNLSKETEKISNLGCGDVTHGLDNIAQWDNKLADGMMSIPDEAAAFGEVVPLPKF